MNRRYLLGLGLGLAVAATFAARTAKPRGTTTYVPANPNAIVATVPPADPDETRARAAFASSRDDIALAVPLARADIARYRARSDPRYLGRAQATLGHWWALAAPPADVRLLRGIIEQSLHAFGASRADLDAVIAERPGDAQAQLTRAVVATVTADYAAARASCAALRDPVLAEACRAPLDALADPAAAYAQLAAVIAHADPAIRTWAMTTLAEIAVMRGANDDAELLLRQVVASDAEDHYARDALADVMLRAHRYTEASQLLAGYEQIDSHLVRRAIAEHLGHGVEAAALAGQMRERIAAAAVRGDRVHVREEAWFAFDVEGDRARALALATENWNVQKELADARLLVRIAGTTAPVLAWMRANHVHDAILGAE